MRRKPPYTHPHIATIQFENPATGERWEGWSAHKTRELAERRVENCARETATRRRVSYSIKSPTVDPPPQIDQRETLKIPAFLRRGND